MQTILSLLGATLGLIAAVMIWLTIAQWTVMRGAERPVALVLITVAAILVAGVILHARGLS